MKIKILIILFIISLAFNLGVLVKVLFKSTPSGQGYAHEEHVHEVGCVHEDWKESPVCRQLNLTCQQLDQMERYRIQFQNRISPLTTKLEKERLKLFHLLKKDTLDEKGADEILQQISNYQNKIQKCFIHHFFQTKKLFNKDQQKRFYLYVQQCLYRGDEGSCSPRIIEVEVKENDK